MSIRVILARVFLWNGSLSWVGQSHVGSQYCKSFISRINQTLDHNQAAPIGFLLLEKAVVSLLGNSDYALGTIALVAGLISIQ